MYSPPPMTIARRCVPVKHTPAGRFYLPKTNHNLCWWAEVLGSLRGLGDSFQIHLVIVRILMYTDSVNLVSDVNEVTFRPLCMAQ